MKLLILALFSVVPCGFFGCITNTAQNENSVNSEIRFSVIPTRDSVSHSGNDSLLLKSFADYTYTGDSNTVRVSKTRDTITFTFKSYDDKLKASSSMQKPIFKIVTTSSGDKIIYGDISPYFSDAIVETEQTKYSLNAKAIIPMGLTLGKYKLIIRSTTLCFCTNIHSEFYSSEFEIK